MSIPFLMLATLLVSLISTGIFKKYALKKAILDLPNERSSHQQPIPRGGGIVFVGLFYLLLSYLFAVHAIPKFLLMSLLGGLPVAIIGYCDDLYSVKIHWRMLIHIFSATWGIWWLPMPHTLITIFAIFMTVWFINLYNFMDGIDGLAASEAIFVSAVAGIVLLQTDKGIAILCFGLAFSVLGFLYWNWSPAKIFMGDIASGFLGYFFAILLWSTASIHLLPIFFWIILLAVFLIDATFTLLRRILQRKKWYQAHREHIYQRLVEKGLAHHHMTLLVISINMMVLLPLAFCVIH